MNDSKFVIFRDNRDNRTSDDIRDFKNVHSCLRSVCFLFTDLADLLAFYKVLVVVPEDKNHDSYRKLISNSNIYSVNKYINR